MIDTAPFRVGTIDHVGIAVHNPANALRHYQDELGLPVVGDEIADAPGVRLIYLDAGGVSVQLVVPVRPGPVAEFLRERGEGLHHICFRVPRLAPALSRIPGQTEVQEFLGGQGRHCAFLSTPEAPALTELIEIDRR